MSLTSFVDLYPRKVKLTFNSAPPGLTLYVDGVARTTPFSLDTLVGFRHNVEARNQTSGGLSYTFTSWSDEKAQQHEILVSTSDQTYAATYTVVPAEVVPMAFKQQISQLRGTTRAPFQRRVPMHRLRETQTSSRSVGGRMREKSLSMANSWSPLVAG